MWKDSSGRRLTDYPRPSVAVDVAVLTFADDQLKVVTVDHRAGGIALPGTFLHENERLADAAERALREKATMSGVDFRQLAVFDDPERDERGWVLSVGHIAAVPMAELPVGVRLIEVVDGNVTEPLLFDHALIVQRAVDELRDVYAGAVDPYGLCGRAFSVLALRRLYEAVFGHALPKDSFRRHVSDQLEETGRTSSEVVGRPAALFRRKPNLSLPPAARSFFVSGGR